MTGLRCKDCIAEGITTYRHAPFPGPRCATHHRARNQVVSAAARGRNWLAKYGITAGEYDAILEAQGGHCAICNRANGRTKKLAVDHDHALEAAYGPRASVRGLLCGPCNRMLGDARDSPEFFARAVRYLLDPPAPHVLNAH
ncbi:MAG: endonuclease VII domain-containing protein [Sporichthyaceae bacterium]